MKSYKHESMLKRNQISKFITFYVLGLSKCFPKFMAHTDKQRDRHFSKTIKSVNLGFSFSFPFIENEVKTIAMFRISDVSLH